MPDVSVIIVSWNAKAHLLNCLHSLIDTANGYSQELIVVDNASSDGSPDVVASQFPAVKLIKNAENLGFAKANNIGMQTSRGRYVCLINSDVIVLEGCIEKLMAFMDENHNVGMTGPRILNPDHSLQVQCRRFPTIWNNICQALGFNKLFPKSAIFSEPFMNYWAHDKVQKVDVITGCFWMVRRKAVDKVGLLDEDFFIYAEDIDWCKRFNKAGWDVLFYPEAEAIHIGGASSDNAPIKFYLEMQKADLQYWRKHHGKLGQASYLVLIFLRHMLRMPSGALQYIVVPSKRKSASYKLRRNLACLGWLVRGCPEKVL